MRIVYLGVDEHEAGERADLPDDEALAEIAEGIAVPLEQVGPGVRVAQAMRSQGPAVS